MNNMIDFSDVEARLADFSDHAFLDQAHMSPILRGLAYLLITLKWEGTASILSDAYINKNTDLDSFHATLSKLGYRCHIEQFDSLSRIQDDQFPCLITFNNISAIALAKRDNTLFLYDYQNDNYFEQDELNTRCEICATTIYSQIFREPPPESQDKSNWLKYAFYKYNDEIRSLVILSLIINLLGTLQPFFIMSVYNFALTASSTSTLFWITSFAILVAIIEFYFKRFRMRILNTSGKDLAHFISAKVIGKLLWLPYSMTSTAGVSSQIARLKDIDQFRKLVTAESTLSYFDLPFVVVFVVAILAMSGTAALTVIAGIAVMLCFCMISRYFYAQATSKSSRANAMVSYQWNELLRGIPFIQGLPVVRVLKARFSAAVDQSIDDAKQVAVTNGKIQAIGQSLIQVIGTTSIVTAVYGVMGGTADAGSMLAIVILVWKALGPIMGIYNSLTKYQSIVAAANQINALMSLNDDSSRLEKSPPIQSFAGHMSLAGISHRYPGAPIGLTNLSFNINPGDKVAISGAQGTGKTTLLSILAGIEERYQGALYVDGQNIKQFNNYRYRKSVNYIPLEIHYFDSSIYYNAIIYNGYCSRERVTQLFHSLGLQRWFTQGIDSVLTYNKINMLPNGALQLLRFCIGLSGSSNNIILIDEPLLGVEHEFSRFFSKLFHEEFASSTVIYVTSDKNLIANASHCLLLDKDGSQKFYGAPDKVIQA
ncbi:ATP-binding cassette domain-containing protein [Thaumasiovibrio subtropicus]|uniref:ATP-binding cassette domain-containing protein n=1 Tax=Thaumasiovibrio subtropicus TaxID=1891207 RepID=UPI000B35672E|nr:ATP-binding cassette domain-containing protein [Thaumasiovibrio subtropicus]